MLLTRTRIAVSVGMLMVLSTLAASCADDDSVSGPATFLAPTTTAPESATTESATSEPADQSAPADAKDDTEPDPSPATPEAGTSIGSPEGDPTTSSVPAASTTSADGGPTTTAGTNDASSTTVAGAEATSTTATTATTATTSTTVVPDLPVAEPTCVVEVAAGDSLSLIADRFDDDTVTVPAIRTENAIVGDDIDAGDFIDVCVANGINDVTGEQRTEADAVAVATLTAVEAQQRQLNVLFAPLGTPPLLVDGVSGRVTRQRLCAARLALGLPVSTTDMLAGSPEEQALMTATSLPIPFSSAALSPRWILIDQTCQIMFGGSGTTQLAFAFPTSTGLPEFPTRLQDRSRVFKYNPVLENGGWHDSTTYPAAEDNPVNGNMYKPLYFDRGLAIHGALNVPTDPQSHGCARLRVEHQELLIAWLGLGDATGPIYDKNRINVTVNVQGQFIPAA